MKHGRWWGVWAWLALMLVSVGLQAQPAATATAEPSVHQIYEAAGRGDIRGARAMVDEVLQKHPGSAKAHYVKAELAARDNDPGTARSELQAAEKIAPGLPFAKPEAVSALRAQVDRLSSARSAPAPVENRRAPDTRRVGAAPPAAAGGGFPMWTLLIVAALVVGGFVLFRRRPASLDPYPQQPVAPPYARDDAFGRGDGPGYPPPYPAPGYPQPGYPQPGYPQAGYPQQPAYPPQQPGMGSTLGRGLATGLAIGAGAVAAQEIGRRMFDHGHEGQAGGQGSYDPGLGRHPSGADSSLARDAGLGALDPSADPNRDMGGQDFGIADGGWDDGGVADAGGGGDDWNT